MPGARREDLEIPGIPQFPLLFEGRELPNPPGANPGHEDGLFLLKAPLNRRILDVYQAQRRAVPGFRVHESNDSLEHRLCTAFRALNLIECEGLPGVRAPVHEKLIDHGPAQEDILLYDLPGVAFDGPRERHEGGEMRDLRG